MSYYSNEQKKQVYNRWLQNGRPWFDIDQTKEPTYSEKKIILEMLKRENTKLKQDKELEESKKKFDKYYKENRGKIQADKIFDTVSKELGDY